MAGIKINDLPALGRDLASTDLFEMSLAGGTGSRKITGQEIMNTSKLNIGTTPIVSGTVGRVLFEGTGNVVQESANLFWDNTNGRLGIGTATPAYKLDVLGVIKTSSIYGKGDGTSDRYFAFDLEKPTGAIPSIVFGAYDNNATRYLAIGGEAGSSKYATQYLYFFTGATNTTVAGTRAMSILPSGNIICGSGITDAGFKLDVNGTAIFRSNITLNSNALYIGANSAMSLSTASSDIYLSNGNTSRKIIFDLTGSGQFQFNNGNVLIGTTSDNGFKLDVNGTARVQGNLTAIGAIGSVIEHTALTNYNGFGGFQLNVSGGIERAFVKLQPNSGEFKIGTALGGGYFLTLHSAGSEAMRVFTTGNVAINTTTDAGYKLDVNGTARVQGNVTVTGTNISISNAAMSIDSNVGTGIFNLINNGGSAGNTRMSLGGVTYFNIYQPISAASGITSGTINTITTPITYAWASGTASPNLFQLNPNYNFTGTYTGTARGFYYNPTLTSIVGLTHFAFHSTSGRIRFENLPTSPVGLNAGDLYNNLGVLMIV